MASAAAQVLEMSLAMFLPWPLFQKLGLAGALGGDAHAGFGNGRETSSRGGASAGATMCPAVRSHPPKVLKVDGLWS
jgi:hypothetical protein